MIPIDIVIPFVDNNDPDWQYIFIKESKKQDRNYNRNNSRYRRWNNFKYWFRGVAKFMPWIRKVHLILMQPSQIPEWLNTSSVNIVYHKDIIPEEYLPTFNSNTIEMFIHNIPDLSEHFVYSNDDMFAIGNLSPDNFFDKDGNPKTIVQWYSPKELSVWEQMLSNDANLIKEHFKLDEKGTFFKNGHNMQACLKSVRKEVFDLYKDRILKSCTQFRDTKNYTPILFYGWQYYKYPNTTSKLNQTYIGLQDVDEDILSSIIINKNKQYQLVCLNDGGGVRNYKVLKKTIINSFKELLPDKCKYEN